MDWPPFWDSKPTNPLPHTGLHRENSPLVLCQDLPTFSQKGLIVNIAGSTGLEISVAIIQHGITGSDNM